MYFLCISILSSVNFPFQSLVKNKCTINIQDTRGWVRAVGTPKLHDIWGIRFKEKGVAVSGARSKKISFRNPKLPAVGGGYLLKLFEKTQHLVDNRMSALRPSARSNSYLLALLFDIDGIIGKLFVKAPFFLGLLFFICIFYPKEYARKLIVPRFCHVVQQKIIVAKLIKSIHFLQITLLESYLQWLRRSLRSLPKLFKMILMI